MLGGQGWVGRILKIRVLNLCHNENITCLNYFSKIEISYFFLYRTSSKYMHCKRFYEITDNSDFF